MRARSTRSGITPALASIASVAQTFRSAWARRYRPDQPSPRLRRSAVALRAKAEGPRYETRGFAARARSGLGQTVTTLTFVVIGGGSSLLACPVCFGAEETAMIDGTKLGIVVMLAITFAVQGAFAGFFFYLRRRAKRIAEIELDTEWSELQRARTR